MLLFRFYFPQDYKTCRIFQFIFLNIYQCAVLIRHDRYFFFRYNLEFDHVLITKKELIFFLTHYYDLDIFHSLSFTFSLPISIFFFATRMSWNLKLVTRTGIMKQKIEKKVCPVKIWKIVQDKNSAEIWQESDVNMKSVWIDSGSYNSLGGHLSSYFRTGVRSLFRRSHGTC